MTSLLDVRLGVLEPQILHLPPDVVSHAAAEEAIELADGYGVADGHPLDDSQRFTLRAAMGERANGRWAAKTVADFEPRQNGKNDAIAARELWGLILGGERLIIHTAHEFPTANESFLRLVSVFENWDDLRRRVARIRYANGEQGIELLSGQRLKYRARTGGSGRGFAKADLVVYDEAQHLKSEAVSASGPAKLANPNSQSWYAGSGGLSTSTIAWRMRREALRGDPGLYAYVEHTAEQLTVTPDGRVTSSGHPQNLLAPDLLALANPAYGRRIDLENFETARRELQDMFARECLCIWDPAPDDGGGWEVIPYQAWQSTTRSADQSKPVTFGVDVASDRSSSSIGAAWPSGDGLHVAVVRRDIGTGWVAARLVELQERWGGQVVVDLSSPAGSLVPDLEKAGVTVSTIASGEYGRACGDFYDGIIEGRYGHDDDDVLASAVAGVVKRTMSDAWAWDRRHAVIDITPIGAVTLAAWGAKTLTAAPIFIH